MKSNSSSTGNSLPLSADDSLLSDDVLDEIIEQVDSSKSSLKKD